MLLRASGHPASAVGQKIFLHPASNGVRRYLTAEVTGSCEGLLPLVTGKPLDNIFYGGGHGS